MLGFVLLVCPHSDDHMVVIEVWSPCYKIFPRDQGWLGHNDGVLVLMGEVVLGDNTQSGRRQQSDAWLLLALILGFSVTIEDIHIIGPVKYWHFVWATGKEWLTINYSN